MQAKNKKRFLALPMAALLGMSLFLGACRDDLQDRPEAAQEQITIRPTSDYIGKVNLIVEVDVVPLTDPEGRVSVDFKVVSRTDKKGQDGSATPTGADYAEEYAPRMNFRVGDQVTGYLLFLLDDGTTTSPVFRQQVDFEVIEGTTASDGRTFNIGAKNRVRFAGDVTFPAGYKLEQEFKQPTSSETTVAKYPEMEARETRWKVMAMLGDGQRSQLPNWSSTQDIAGGNRLLFGHYESGYMFTSHGNPSNDYSLARTGDNLQLNVPCVSDWKPLYILRTNASTPGKDYLGANFDLRFRPEGVLLQYDLWSLAYDVQDIRRIGVISNAIDFKGYYDLNADRIRAAYNGKDGDNYGVPAWEALAPNAQGLSMNYAPASEAALSNGARVFPWDMPTLSSSEHTNLRNWTGASDTWGIDNPSVLDIYFRGNTGAEAERGNWATPVSQLPWLNQSKRLWTFLTLGGRGNSDRRIFYFWGMPRTGANKVAAGREATYFYASTYSLTSNEEAYDSNEANIDTQRYSELDREARRRTREMNSYYLTNRSQYEYLKGFFETDPRYNNYSDRFPGGLFPAYTTATRLIADEVMKANREHVAVPSQTLLILHQTSNAFSTLRRIYHAQVVLKPDLLFTEVDYLVQNGQNYSMLEISNPTAEPVDLSQYGVVRLIPSTSGDYLAFRSSAGQPVDQLSQALILPLTALKNQADPFDGSALDGMKPASYSYSLAGTTQRGHLIVGTPNRSSSTMGSAGVGPQFDMGQSFSYSHILHTQMTNRPFYMMPGQTIVLGASGHVNAPTVTLARYDWENPSLKAEASWFRTYYDQLTTQHQQQYMRYAYAYADGDADGSTYKEGTLDYRPGDAFALVKKTATGWQIIDATGPVGRQQLAFAGTYAAFKAEFDKYSSSTAFAASRNGGVSYPFIAPFRTQRLRPSEWSDDRTVSELATGFTPGRRFQDHGTDLYTRRTHAYFKRTPLDLTFTTYQNARPTRGY